MRETSIYPPTLDGNDVELKRKEIQDYFHNTYNLFEKMFDMLANESVFYKKSEPTRHPMIFYYGHTATFFINKLFIMNLIDKRINPEFENMFAIGVDEMAWDDLNESNYTWPSVIKVKDYREKVRELVDGLIMSLDFTLPIKEDSAMWIILMGIEHERIHIETSSVLHRQMPLEFVKDVSEFNICEEFGKAPKNEMLKVRARHVKLGKEKSHNLYGWDNEYGIYKERVEEFFASKYLVSNGEYMEFVKDGGYENIEFWDEEGKKFLEIRGAKHPPFWYEENGEYLYRTLTKIIDMPLSWPVDVNALEAVAFCRWKSQKEGVTYTLPSEAEYMALYEQVGLVDVPEFDDTKANLNFAHYFSSSSVDKFMFDGFGDVVGNVWQWSRTPIFGFDGFEVHEAYDDFSTPTFDNKHALILGSSWASSGNLIMKHSRYAFRRHFYQHAGFRYVITPNEKEIEANHIDEDVLQNCKLQYESEFTKECVAIAIRHAKIKTKALDIGCGVGRATFELAHEFDEVTGADFSARFIKVAIDLLAEKTLSCGNIELDLEKLGFADLQERVSFWQGDVNNLKPHFRGYDLILCTNVDERFREQKQFLQEAKNRLNHDGVLVLVLPKEYEADSYLKEDFYFVAKYDVQNTKVVVWEKK